MKFSCSGPAVLSTPIRYTFAVCCARAPGDGKTSVRVRPAIRMRRGAFISISPSPYPLPLRGRGRELSLEDRLDHDDPALVPVALAGPRDGLDRVAHHD